MIEIQITNPTPYQVTGQVEPHTDVQNLSNHMAELEMTWTAVTVKLENLTTFCQNSAECTNDDSR